MIFSLPKLQALMDGGNSEIDSILLELEAFDISHADETAILLASPTPQAIQAYYDALISSAGGGLKVQLTTDMGKGVFADRDFEAEEVILQETKLVGMQHLANKAEALVCSFCFCHIGSIEMQISRILESETSFLGGKEDSTEMDGCKCLHSDNRLSSIPTELRNSFKKAGFRLPYTDNFRLPSAVPCLGGCVEEVFCSKGCAEAAWESHHCYLCTGPFSLCQNIEALVDFKQFASESNEIFNLASQVISAVLVRAKRLKIQLLTQDGGHLMTEDKSVSAKLPGSYDFSFLLEAWKPFSMSHKGLWWTSVALPEDIGSGDEAAFRNQIRELAAASLFLLKKALYQEEFGALFSFEVYGNIIGMFELNNLDIVVPSPIKDYFHFLDRLELAYEDDKLKAAKSICHAFEGEYEFCCRGTGFFAIQSCFNHSCDPNAEAFKRQKDKDGKAVVLSTQKIKKGHQIFVSYIDEGASIEERKSMLTDYGFICRCEKCTLECSTSSSFI